MFSYIWLEQSAEVNTWTWEKKYSEDREICIVMSYIIHDFTKHY